MHYFAILTVYFKDVIKKPVLLYTIKIQKLVLYSTNKNYNVKHYPGASSVKLIL